MDNAPNHASVQAHSGRNNGASSRQQKHSNHSNRKLKIAAAIAAILVTVGLALGVWSLYLSSVSAYIDSGKYQAVFLTNGQVYFGKLQKLNGGYFKLNDVYYLQAKKSATESDPQNPQATTDQQESGVELVKLGNEVHGPEDEMIVGKEQILFFENLKKDGVVSNSIIKNKTQKNN